MAERTSKKNRRRSKPAQLLAKILLMFAVVIIMDVAIGLILCRDGYFLGKKLPPYDLVFNDAQRKHMQEIGANRENEAWFDADLGWAPPPNFGDHINAAGIRASREYDLSPPADKTRIAAFGDSFTYSVSVDRNEETWAYLLEQSQPDIEVLNFGVGGFGTDQAFLRYQRDGAKFKPETVLIGFMVENILRNVSVYRPAYNHYSGGVSVKPRFKVDESGELVLLEMPVKSEQQLKDAILSREILNTLYKTDFWVRRAPLAYRKSALHWSSLARIVCTKYERQRSVKYYYAKRESEPFQVTFAILKTFYQSALKDGAKRALVILFPSPEDVDHLVKGGKPYWDTMASELRAAGVKVLDVSPGIVEAVKEHGPKGYFKDMHYSPAGDRIVAKAIASELFPTGNGPQPKID